MKWKEYPKDKPERDATCVVKNEKGWMGLTLAIYYKLEDTFVLYKPSSGEHYPLDITHFLELE